MVSRRVVAGLLASCAVASSWLGLGSKWVSVASADESELSKTAGGLTVYLGVVPAEIVKGLAARAKTGPPMHGGVPSGPHEYHLVAAVFDAATANRVSDVTVTAEVSGLGLSGPSKRLEPMQIAGTTTFGGFFDLPGFDLYTVKLTVERAGASPTVLQFKYDHRR